MPFPYNAVDYLDPRIWTGFVRQVPVPASYIGDSLLPMKDVPGDKLMWDIFTAENPIAPFVAVNAESPRMDDEQITQAFADIVYIRHKRELKESDVRWVRDFGMAPATTQVGQMAAAAKERMGRSAERLSLAVDARKEWMQISSLLGSLAVSPRGADQPQSNVTFTINYPVTQLTPATLWSDTVNSDPIADIQNWFRDLFFAEVTMIAPRPVWYYLMRNANIRRLFFSFQGYGPGTLPSTFTQSQIQNVFAGELGLKGVDYNAMYTTRVNSGTAYTVTRNRFLPQNKVIFLPTEKVGYTATAPAPQNNWQTGKFAWTIAPEMSGRVDPWVYEMGCGLYGLPILEQPWKVLVATVA